MNMPKVFFEWEHDGSVNHMKEYDCYDSEPDTCESCFAYIRDPQTDMKIVLASLHCIDNADDEYRHIIESELLVEAEQDWSNRNAN